RPNGKDACGPTPRPAPRPAWGRGQRPGASGHGVVRVVASGGPRASAPDPLRRLLGPGPPWALVVADAGHVGEALRQQLGSARAWFLLRLPAPAPLYPVGRPAVSRRGGRAYSGPQQARQAPVLVRVVRRRGPKVVGVKRTPVGLRTNVREAKRWPWA